MNWRTAAIASSLRKHLAGCDSRQGDHGQGSYFPAWLLEPRRRSEKALTAVVAEAYALGVSTRKVEDLVQALGIEKLSKSQVSQLAKELDGVVKSSESGRSRDRTSTSGSMPST